MKLNELIDNAKKEWKEKIKVIKETDHTTFVPLIGEDDWSNFLETKMREAAELSKITLENINLEPINGKIGKIKSS